MSCGHEGCTCGPNDTPDAAPAAAHTHEDGHGCCGGHDHGHGGARHRHHHDHEDERETVGDG